MTALHLILGALLIVQTAGLWLSIDMLRDTLRRNREIRKVLGP